MPRLTIEPVAAPDESVRRAIQAPLAAFNEVRGGASGFRLLALAAEARRRGCHAAWVDTIFGARGFCERLGCRVFGELADHPPGHGRSFLRKALA